MITKMDWYVIQSWYYGNHVACTPQLSLEEILNHEELFVGSRISDSISNNLGHVVHWEL